MKRSSYDESSSCSKQADQREHQNYVTLDKLLKEVGEPVVRKQFDIEFDPAVLQRTLNGESSKIRKFINVTQSNILFPPKGQKPVCSSDLDLTLMILLIRKLTPIEISEKLPVPCVTSQGADLSRIKYYRNKLAHGNGRITDIEFEQQWMEICQAIVRLGGESYKEICAQLRVTSLAGGKGYGMKNIHKEIIEDWEEIEIKMVETNAIKELTKLIKKSNFIAVVGPSGCGKSTAAHHVALILHRNDGYQIIPSHFPTDITHYYNESEKQVFVFDDVCGKYSIDYDILKQWKTLSTELNKIKQCENVRILVSSRSDIFCQFQDVQVLSSTKFDMLSNEYSLCDDECFLIAKTHVGVNNAEILRKANLFKRYDFFPLLCQIFGTEKGRQIKDFFEQPVKVIKEELTLMKKEKDQTSFAVLALFVIYNNCITEEELSPKSGIKNILSDIAEECELLTSLNIKVVKKHLESFLHSYVKKIGSSYMIMHDKIFDIFVSFYGEHLPDIILTHCSYPVIFSRFKLQPAEDTDEYMIIVPVGKETEYFQRLFNVLDLKDFAKLFWHTQLQYKTFRQRFLRFLSEDRACCNLCLSLSNTEYSPLITTAQRGFHDILKVLLHMGMNVNVCDEFDLTPLTYAAANGAVQTFDLLLENNGDIHKQPKYDPIWPLLAKLAMSVLFSRTCVGLAFNNFITELIRNIMEGTDDKFPSIGAYFGTSIGAYFGTPLYIAALFGNTDIVKLLLKQKCNIDQYDSCHVTSLFIASLCNRVDIVGILLKHGCDINICNSENQSPLYIASTWGHVDVVKLLLDHNCSLNICDNNRKESPLHAASKCYVCNPRPNIPKPEFLIYRLLGFVCSSSVSKKDYGEIVKLLLNRNADADVYNIDNKTPMEVALENKNAEIVKLFVEHSTAQLQ